MRQLTHQHGIPLIVDDRLDVALAVDADGRKTQYWIGNCMVNTEHPIGYTKCSMCDCPMMSPTLRLHVGGDDLPWPTARRLLGNHRTGCGQWMQGTWCLSQLDGEQLLSGSS